MFPYYYKFIFKRIKNISDFCASQGSRAVSFRTKSFSEAQTMMRADDILHYVDSAWQRQFNHGFRVSFDRSENVISNASIHLHK